MFQIKCYINCWFLNDVFTTVNIDQRKIRIDVQSEVKHIRFDNKEYIITPDRLRYDQLDVQCATYSSEYKPAYINYNEEYEMWVRNEFKIQFDNSMRIIFASGDAFPYLTFYMGNYQTTGYTLKEHHQFLTIMEKLVIADFLLAV